MHSWELARRSRDGGIVNFVSLIWWMPPAAPFCNGTKWGKSPQGVCGPLDPDGGFNVIADALCPAASSAEGPAAYSVTPPAAAVIGNVVFSAAAPVIVGAGQSLPCAKGGGTAKAVTEGL